LNAHWLTQTPFEQAWSTPHLIPQSPQLPLSVCKFAQYGVPPSVPQSVWLMSQDDWHAPLLQTSFAPHFRPHLPQFWLSVCSGAQYGAPPSGAQSVCPDVLPPHDDPHPP
jgi:hypothetical protein